MPGSNCIGKDDIKMWLSDRNDIKTIVDVGPGSGTYPKLLGAKYTWIGIEIWEPYIKQFDLLMYYKEVIVGDIQYVELPKADCIIFGDVLEHLPKKAAKQVLQKALQTYRHVIVSIPCTEEGELQEAKIHYGNEHEAHLSGWKISELRKMADWKKVITSRKQGIFII